MGRDHTIRVDNPNRAPLTWRRDSGRPMRDEIVWSVADGIATVTLNRPDQRNAMNIALLTGLRLCFERLDERSDARVVVVRGAGPAFCSGMDLKGLGQQVVPPADLEATTYTLARTVADNAPLSLTGMKAVILRTMTPREIAHDDLDVVVQRARQSADASEGRRAMLEKRAPEFRGR